MEEKNQKRWTWDCIYSIFVLFLCRMGPFLPLSVISLFAKQLTGSDAFLSFFAKLWNDRKSLRVFWC